MSTIKIDAWTYHLITGEFISVNTLDHTVSLDVEGKKVIFPIGPLTSLFDGVSCGQNVEIKPWRDKSGKRRLKVSILVDAAL